MTTAAVEGLDQHETLSRRFADRPNCDGLITRHLERVRPDTAAPGPHARVDALRRHLSGAQPRRDLVVSPRGYLLQPKIGARLRAKHAWLLEEHRVGLPSGRYRVPITVGHCMDPFYTPPAEIEADTDRHPLPGEAVGVRWRVEDFHDTLAWLLWPIPPRESWGHYPDALAAIGNEDYPGAIVVVPLAAIERIESIEQRGPRSLG